MRASKKYVNYVYNNYTFAGPSGLVLVCQKLLAIPLPMSLHLAIEAHSFRVSSFLGSALGFGLVAVSLALASLSRFFETCGFIHHHHMIRVLLQVSFGGLKHSELFVLRLVHPIHVVIHDKTAVRWWE